MKCPWGNNYDMTICVMPHRKLQGHCNYSLFAAWEVKWGQQKEWQDEVGGTQGDEEI